MAAVWAVELGGGQSSAGPPSLRAERLRGPADRLPRQLAWVGQGCGALWAPQKAAAASQREGA